MKINVFLLVIIAILVVAVFYFQNKADKAREENYVPKPDTVVVPSQTVVKTDTVIFSRHSPPEIRTSHDTVFVTYTDTVYQNVSNHGITDFKDEHSFEKYGSLLLSGSVRWPQGETRLIYAFTPPGKKWKIQPLIGVLDKAFVGLEIGKQSTFSFAPLYQFQDKKIGFYIKFNF